MLLRDQRYITLGQTSKQILGPNTRRKAVIITSPPALMNPQSPAGDQKRAISTATTGVKSSFTLPAGQGGILVGATFNETTGTGVIATLELVRGGLTYTLGAFTTQGAFGTAMVLQPGDQIQWDVTTAVALSVSDFTISVAQDQLSQRVTISFMSPAVVDQGITIPAGALPLRLDAEDYADSLTNEINAIANAGSPTIGVLDIFGG